MRENPATPASPPNSFRRRAEPSLGRQVLRRLGSLVAGLLLIALAIGSAPVAAHEIPTDVRITAFVRPQQDRLQLLMRVPLAAMREVDMPLRGPGYLDLEHADAALRTAVSLWLADNLTLQENDAPLGTPTITALRVSLASDRSFADVETALAHLRGPPLPARTDLYWNQQLLDVQLDYPIRSAQARFAIDARLARLGLRVAIALHFIPQQGVERAFQLHGDEGLVRLEPSWTQAAVRFVGDGFRHILEGTDHLLFIASLVIPLRRLGPLLGIVTAFTVAHSLTLAASVLGWAPDALWFAPLVETLIAASILFLALENLLGASVSRRWIIAFVFGLVHGFGFAFALRESLQFAGDHLALALLSFNLGVELGQIAVLLVLVPALALLFRSLPERAVVLVLSALVAHTAWHWLTERWAQLAMFPLPVPDMAGLAVLLRWLAAAIVIGFLLRAVDGAIRRRRIYAAGAASSRTSRFSRFSQWGRPWKSP
jgi:hypothetical protein